MSSSLPASVTIPQYQRFIGELYGLNNARHWNAPEILTNVERFSMRMLKGIRKADAAKTKSNAFIALSWFTSFLNQLQVDLEEIVWRRFPYHCSYCGTSPCSCRKNKVVSRKAVSRDDKQKPKTFAEYQEMFQKIYPAESRTLSHAGIHLAEEVGELAEAFLLFRGSHRPTDFANVELEAADYFSCLMGVLNSLGVNAADEISRMYNPNCHECHAMPCRCGYEFVASYKS